MKGIVLAGGTGSRLWPSTLPVCKALLPVYDKPMIYYPVSTLMLAGIKDIIIISTPEDTPRIEALLGDGSSLGVKFSYRVEEEPRGIAQAFFIAGDLIENEKVALIFCDNIFYGHDFSSKLKNLSLRKSGATIFGYHVKDPRPFGVIEFDENKKVLSLEEKPSKPKSNWAAVGLYFYDEKVLDYARSLKPSARGELEITDINNIYLSNNDLSVELLGRGYAWLDTGSHETLLEASNFVSMIENNQGVKIACLEEIAWRKGYISDEQLRSLAKKLEKSSYGEYLKAMLEGFLIVE
ncbi:MAG: glucose-1-phosphate thymidylyltransferase RfbA [Spirochaetales bacterium]|nr:glucose-1-phosphate thymidylyltransferase RfbA [Spirochaetales bacterium]